MARGIEVGAGGAEVTKLESRSFGLGSKDERSMVMITDDRKEEVIRAWCDERIRYAQVDAEVHAAYFMRLVALGIPNAIAAQMVTAWIEYDGESSLA